MRSGAVASRSPARRNPPAAAKSHSVLDRGTDVCPVVGEVGVVASTSMLGSRPRQRRVCGESAAVDRSRGGPPELSHGLIGRVYRRVVDPSSYQAAVSVVSGVPEHWRGCGGGRLDAERSSRVRFGRRGPARRGGGIHCEAALLAADEDGESMSGEAASGGRRWPSSWRGDAATRGGEGWGAPGW